MSSHLQYSGCLFFGVGSHSESYLQRYVGVGIEVTKAIAGLNVSV